ncbi:MAG: M13 family peptidase, partial [Proteobacteria bacterium]|nr:M13 family peptidase [Pseudomonadota bacterium]
MIAARRLALLVPLLLLTCHAPADAARKVKAHKTKSAPAASVPAACSDFYDHANEAWLKANPAPPSGSVSALDTLRANARAQERTLLE